MYQSRFIDEDMRKHNKAMDHIYLNYDPEVFNHESDKYQQTQKLNQLKTWEINSKEK